MNCQEFENGIHALARGGLADAEAQAHEKSCPRCAARLADERALSGGLRALAAGTKGAEAPARVEATLLAAFRAHAASAAEPAPAGVTGNIVPPARRWTWVRTAAVASLAAAASLALFVLVRPGAGVKTPEVAPEVAGRVGPSNRSSALEAPRGLSVRPSTSEAALTGGVDAVATPSPVQVAVREKPSRASYTTRARVVNASYEAGSARGGRSAAGHAGEADAGEVATEFIPLVQGAQYAQADGGHLVRVELPRAALASFGLPVNTEAPGGRVKADVLLGEDGIARAIRFVR